MNSKIRNTEDLSRVVREARKAQKLSQDDLAGMAGTGRRFIVDLEKGKETAQLGKVLRVLATLGVTVSKTPRSIQNLNQSRTASHRASKAPFFVLAWVLTSMLGHQANHARPSLRNHASSSTL